MVDNSHVAGSSVSARHTLTRVIVGPVPTAWNRTRSGLPTEYVTPGTVTSGLIADSVPFAAVLLIDTPTAPFVCSRTFAR